MPRALAPVKVRQSNITIKFCDVGSKTLINWIPAGVGAAVGSGVKTGANATGAGVGVVVTTM